MRDVPSVMSDRSHRPRCCSASGISSPPGPVRAGRRASVSSISASSPVTSGWPGRLACSARASRIASPDRSLRARSGPLLLAYPSLNSR